MANQAVTGGGVPAETLDTSRISSALSGCGSGKAVKLVTNGANNAFVTGPISIPAGVTLWVDAGVTLYGTRNAGTWGGTTPLIMVSGAGSGLMGDGVVDGQGGEPPTAGGMSPWEQSIAASPGSASVPPLVEVTGSKFTMYKITLHNSPKFHLRLSGSGHVIWGTTFFTPSKATNSVGTMLTPHNARNTDGIDPGASASISNSFIVYNKISVGDDEIAIKGAHGATNLTIGHNHFGSGHGMSIGSETNGGVSGVNVCDLTIDNSMRATGSPSTDINGIRIKSDASRGGLVQNITYSEVCVRDVDNPLILNPNYDPTKTGSLIPQYTNITVHNFHAMSTSVSQIVTLDGFDSSHISTATLDNAVVDGTVSVAAQNATVTLGPGAVSFASSITGTGVTVKNNVSGTSTPIDCSNRWVSIP